MQQYSFWVRSFPSAHSLWKNLKLFSKTSIFAFLFLLGTVSSSTAEEKEYYDKELSHNSPRIRILKENLKSDKDLPSSFLLYFKEIKPLEIVFYDLEGYEIYFQYRKTKFDHEAADKLHPLFPGRIYEVKGKYKGVITVSAPNQFRKKIITTLKLKNVTVEDLKDRANIWYYDLVSFQERSSNQLLF